MRATAILVVAMCSSAFGCATAQERVPVGSWSGPNANLLVDRDTSLLEIPCTAASIHSTLLLDADGRFTVRARMGTYGASYVARSGTVSGQLRKGPLVLTVRFDGAVADFGSYVLERKPRVELPPCG
jgi:hypothetical protein